MNGTTTVSLVGVGGQGILPAAAILAATASAEGLEVKAGEVKGMAQRGGAVLSTVRLGEHVWSPVARRARVAIATELLEGHRGLGRLGPEGTLVCAVPTRALPGGGLRREGVYPDDPPGSWKSTSGRSPSGAAPSATRRSGREGHAAHRVS